MNNLNKSLFAGISLLWLLVACSSDELVNRGVPQNGQAIRFFTNMGSEAKEDSRVSGQTWANNDQVGIFMISDNYNTIHGANALYLTQSEGVKVALASANGHELYYPQTGEVRFIGYYPYNENIKSIEQALPITLGDQDNTAPFDLLWYKDADNTGLFNKDIGNPSINFTHRLSKIVVNLRLANEMENHIFESASLANIPTTALFNLKTGAISGHDTKGEVDFMTSPLTAIDTEAGITQRFEAIIIPHTGKAEDGEETAFTSRIMTFEVVDPAGETMTLPWEVQDDKTFESNKLYTYNLTLTRTGIDFMGVTINDWSTTEIDENLESDNLRLSKYESIVPKEGYSGTLNIKTSFDGVPVAVSSDETWLNITPVTGVDGKYSLSYTAEANETGESRRATVTVTAGTLEVTNKVYQSAYSISDGTVVASANSIVLVTNGETALIPITIVNEPATYPGVSDGPEVYVKPFNDGDIAGFEVKVLWIDVPNFENTVLQATNPTDIIAEVGEVYATLDQSYLVVKPGTHQGNAVVCITKPGTDDIIWSWHIWVVSSADRTSMWIKDSADNITTDKPEPTANGYAFFPLHLGAFNAAGVINTFDYTNLWSGHPFVGLFYNWGRKDPFPNRKQPTWIGSGLEGLELPYIGKVTSLSGGGVERTGLFSIGHPYSNIFNNVAPNGWLGTIHLKGGGNNSWGHSSTYGYDNKSPFDPCPAGWRVPPGNEPYSDALNAWKDVANEKNWFDAESSPYGIEGHFLGSYGGFYPVSGSGSEGYCWTAGAHFSDLNNTYLSTAFLFRYRQNALIPNADDFRNALHSVRCVTE